MAPEKRKQLHDERPAAAGTAPRRTTRHSAGTPTSPANPANHVEPEKQRRSGRIRANTLEEPQYTITASIEAVPKRNDAPKSKPAPAPPSAPTKKKATTTTRRTRGQTADSEAQPDASIVVKAGQPDEKKRSAQPKSNTRQNTVPPPVIPSSPKTEHKVQANTSRPRTTCMPPPRPQPQAYPQAPAANLTDPASVSSITPQRRASSSLIARPPPTPRADRNIDRVVLGNICFKTWYPSYYNKEVLGDASGNVGVHNHGGGAKMGGGKKDKEVMLDRLHVCPCCFKYSKELVSWTGHVRYCQSQAYVPGSKVYIHPKDAALAKRFGGTSEVPSADEGEWSVWEVDGERDPLFCQNLSLFAKLFLDNKSVFFDVTGFTYFLLVYTPPPRVTGDNSPPNICGFFSKEKMSWDNNNLACILVFPPWQRKGLGALLMGVSYEISKREGIIGGPEKPISELGRKGYKRFWAGEIVRWLLNLEKTHDTQNGENEELLVDIVDCSKATWIVQEDCLAILREMDLVEEIGLGSSKPREIANEDDETTKQEVLQVPRVRLDKKVVLQWVEDNKIDLERVCDSDGFIEGYAMRREEKDESE